MSTSGGIVIVGGGLAATRTAEQLRRSEYTGPITIVGDEDHLPLGPAHAAPERIAEAGRGRYGQWGRLLVFSSSDGSDPRLNGRRYVLAWARS